MDETHKNSGSNRLAINAKGKDAAIDIPIGKCAFGFSETHELSGLAYCCLTHQIAAIPSSIAAPDA